MQIGKITMTMREGLARWAKVLVLAVGASGVPATLMAAELRDVVCTVRIDYLLNKALRAPYQKEIVINAGVPFQDDFSTVTRFRYLDAATRLEADRKATTVSFSYYNDVGVLEFIDFRTELKLRDDRVPVTTTGSHAYWSSVGVVGEHTTDYEITCSVLKN